MIGRMPFSTRVQVRYAECDMQGHVFNAHYLTWFDMAHTALLTKALGMSYGDLVASGTDIVVAESGVRYLSPARFEDDLEIEIELDPPTNSSLTSRFTIRRGAEVITRGFLRHVCVSAETLEKMSWPGEVSAAFAPFVSDAAQ